MTLTNTVSRHRLDTRPITPITSFSDNVRSGQIVGRSVAAASATGIALTVVVASAAAHAETPTSVVPQAPNNDFTASIEADDSATLVAVDVAWDGSGIAVDATATAPEAVVEVEEEPVVETVATRSETREYVAAVAPTVDSSSIVAAAMSLLGIPYVYGGTTPAGFDCSGFVQYVYAAVGKSIPRDTYGQAGGGTWVSMADALPGDIVVINGTSHVGIYIGGGQMVHAPLPGGVVEVSPLFGVDGFVRY